MNLRTLALTSLFAIAALAQQNGATAPSKAKKLTRVEVDGLLARPSEVLFIDVRRPDEVSSVGGFPVYLSIQLNQLEEHLGDIPKDRLIVTVSNHAGRASKAADLLESKGFHVAGAVGVQTYEADGGHVTKIEIPAPKPQGEHATK
jgi:rhodanese-related sulfurtransferase